MRSLNKITSLIKRIAFFIPVTWHFVLFVIICLIGYKWLAAKANIPDSSFKDIITVLLSVVFWFGSIIILISLMSVNISFWYFKWNEKRSGIDIKIRTESKVSQNFRQAISIFIYPILRPFLGFIKIRLKYDEKHYSDKFSLVNHGGDKFIDNSIKGVYNWDLPEIKEYRIEKAVIYFEDFFQFFSFALTVDSNSGFHTYPGVHEFRNLKNSPRKTEDMTVRIEELKKIEGELINYKNFESNDDVRRIVWKIYAKNKELVVRIPEILDPFASHVSLYTSFFSNFDVQNSDTVKIPFLNYYKTLCWSVYKQLEKRGFEVRYATDQNIPQNSIDTIEEQVKYAISVSSWQNSVELKNYIKPGEASVVIISSLSNIDQVKELIERFGNDISFVLVPLSDSLSGQDILHWLQWIFIQEEKDKNSVYRTGWTLSLMRPKIEKNEKELMKLLEQYERSSILKPTDI